jgi:peptide/nickel transport system substrate-binding protein
MKKDRVKSERYRIYREDSLKGGKEMLTIGKVVISFVLALCLAVVLPYGDAIGGTKRLRINVQTDLHSVDTPHIRYSTDFVIGQQVFQGLVSFDYAAKPPWPVVPVLAESYEVSEDAKMITFKLRKGVQFHHGYGEFTSEDVVFTLERHLDPKIGSRVRGKLGDIERVEAVDKYTAKVHLKQPTALTLIPILSYAEASWMVSKKAVTKLGDKIAEMPIGTGPFQFDRWNPGEKIVLKKFDKYWRTPAKIDVLELLVIPEDLVSLGALEKGDLDVVPITQAPSYETAKKIKGIYILTSDASPQLYQLMINHKVKPMDDLRVRRALAHALDIKAICDRLGDIAKPWETSFAPSVFSGTNEFYRYDYDVDKAKKLLAEAGYPNGFELRLIYKKQDIFEPIVLEVKNYWDKILDVKLQLIERAVFSQTFKKFKHHVAHWSTSRFSPFDFAERYITGSGQPYFQYSNPEVDEVVMKAKTAKIEEEARKYWRLFQYMVAEDVVMIGVCIQVPLIAVRNNVKGIVPMTSYNMTFENAYIE